MEVSEKELVVWDDSLLVPADATPLDFLSAIYRDAAQPMARRLKAAIAAAQYVHPKLAVVANVNGADIGARVDQARQRSEAVKAAYAAGGHDAVVELIRGPKLIEGKAKEIDPAVMAKPFVSTGAMLRRRA